MKKSIALLLALSMLLALSACGGTSGSKADAPTPVPTETPAEIPSPEPTEEPVPEPTEEPVEEPTEEADPVLGVYDENSFTYTNEFVGLGCQLDESWTLLDQAQIAELNGLVSELVTDEDAKKTLESAGMIQPFYALTEGGLVTVSIGIENLGLLYGVLLNEQSYAEIGAEKLVPALESMGMTDVTSEISTMSFAGSEHVVILVQGQLQGIDFYEALVCIKEDSYMVTVVAGSYLEDLTGMVLDMFYSL